MSTNNNSVSSGVGFGNTTPTPKFGGSSNPQYPNYQTVKLPDALPDSYAPTMPKGDSASSPDSQPQS